METEKEKIPKKGAARKWAQRLKELGDQDPPENLVKKLNSKDKNKKVASPNIIHDDLDF